MNQSGVDADKESCSGLPRAAVGAVVRLGDCFLLVKRANSPSKGRWAVPGGKIKPGETLKEAAQREVLEEARIVVKALKPVQVFDLIERNIDGSIRFHYIIINLRAQYISGEPVPGGDALEARWVSRDNLKKYGLSRKTLELFQESSLCISEKHEVP